MLNLCVILCNTDGVILENQGQVDFDIFEDIFEQLDIVGLNETFTKFIFYALNVCQYVGIDHASFGIPLRLGKLLPI